MIAEGGDDGSWHLDTCLMSCLVVGRKLEWSTLNALVGAATSHNVSYITAIYVPTAKNSMMAGYYDKLGFIRTSVGRESAVGYRLSLWDYIVPTLPFRISE
jgi:predicted enzyme involved in methoxymalonyl-ACP biosynthesis